MKRGDGERGGDVFSHSAGSACKGWFMSWFMTACVSLETRVFCVRTDNRFAARIFPVNMVWRPYVAEAQPNAST